MVIKFCHNDDCTCEVKRFDMSYSIKSGIADGLIPKIKVIGVGGAGCNAVNNMITADVKGVDFYIANTDAQCLFCSPCAEENKIQLGKELLGAGSLPEVGQKAAEATAEIIKEKIQGAHALFITAGMGGGTGTGAAPVIARIAKDMGILVVAVITKPFDFEGSHRRFMAEIGVKNMYNAVDTLIVIPNQNLFRIATEVMTLKNAFKVVDDVLRGGICGITDLIVLPGLINLDFADIRTIMSNMGRAIMGSGEASGENRAIIAAEAAISNPLLDNIPIGNAKGLLINITGDDSMTLFDVDAAVGRVRMEVNDEVNIIFGSAFNDALDGKIRVSVVATGMKEADDTPHHKVAVDGSKATETNTTVNYQGQELRPQIKKNQFSINDHNMRDRLVRNDQSYAAIDEMLANTNGEDNNYSHEHDSGMKNDIQDTNSMYGEIPSKPSKGYFDMPAFLRRKPKVE